jgi:DNA-binding MarR family transcriptional regulator
MAARNDAVTELTVALTLLWRRLRLVAASEWGELSLSHMSVISRLGKEGPLTTAELARAESMKPQSMGAVVATVEELGLVARRAHPTDGRQQHLVLTAKGTAALKSARDAKRTWLAQAIATLDKHDQAALFAAGDILKRLVER